MATPGVIFRIIYHPGTQGVEVDVADEFEQVVVIINQNSLVTPLKEMTVPPFTGIDPASVTE
ncbi:MAG: hypothetical protein FD174_3932 [Geobacteraceae bacterium]|nr:MAG: hypothetical protein FD174_3932 [Geobacteraceae bacterium]